MNPTEMLEYIIRRADMTQRELADALDVTQATVSRWLSGVDPRGSSRDRIIELYRTVSGEDSPMNYEPGTQIPLLSWVSAGKLTKIDSVFEADISRYISVSNWPTGDWIALTVSGDSMDRVAPDGSVIFVDRSDKTLLDGRYYVFCLQAGEVTFKRFRREPRPMLQPFSTNLDHLSIPVDEEEIYVVGRVKRIWHEV